MSTFGSRGLPRSPPSESAAEHQHDHRKGPAETQLILTADCTILAARCVVPPDLTAPAIGDFQEAHPMRALTASNLPR